MKGHIAGECRQGKGECLTNMMPEHGNSLLEGKIAAMLLLEIDSFAGLLTTLAVLTHIPRYCAPDYTMLKVWIPPNAGERLLTEAVCHRYDRAFEGT